MDNKLIRVRQTLIGVALIALAAWFNLLVGVPKVFVFGVLLVGGFSLLLVAWAIGLAIEKVLGQFWKWLIAFKSRKRVD